MFVNVLYKRAKEPEHTLEEGYGFVSGCSCYDLMKRRRRRGKLIGARPEYLDWLEANTPRVARQVRAVFKKQADRLAAALTHETNKLAKISQSDAEMLLSLLGIDDHSLLYGILVQELTDAFSMAAAEGVAMVGLAAEDSLLNLLDKEALGFAQTRGAELVGKKLIDGKLVDNPNKQWAITETTRKGLLGLITEGVQDGLAPKTLAKEIQSAFLFSNKRAETIARTELAFAHMAGNVKGWEQSDEVEAKQSILGSEHDFDDLCDGNAEAGIIPFESAFPSGHAFPPYHPNCVCDVLPVLREGPQ